MVVEPKGNTGSGRTGQQQHNVTLELQSHVNHQADRWAKNTCENGSKSYSSFEIAFSHTCRITAPNLASNDTHNWIAKKSCFVQTVLIIDIIQIAFIKTISGTYWLDMELSISILKDRKWFVEGLDYDMEASVSFHW